MKMIIGTICWYIIGIYVMLLLPIWLPVYFAKKTRKWLEEAQEE